MTDAFGLLDLVQRRTGRANGKEQLGVQVEAGGLLAPVGAHVFSPGVVCPGHPWVLGGCPTEVARRAYGVGAAGGGVRCRVERTTTIQPPNPAAVGGHVVSPVGVRALDFAS